MSKNIYRCAKCRKPLSLISLGIENQRAGKDNFDSIAYLEPCEPCMKREYNEGHSNGYDQGYDEGYAPKTL